MEQIYTTDSLASSGSADERQSVVVVVGSTGVGKSKLAIDLAVRFGGEVVNADALQVYQGLDVTTNKVTAEEAQGVPHHLIGFLDTSAEYTARMFRDHAIPIIDEIIGRGRLPIICGGSNYYVQALVSPYLLDEHPDLSEGPLLPSSKDRLADDSADRTSGASCNAQCTATEPGPRTSASSPHDRLANVDPAAASRLHPNDERKALRYLDIYEKTGKKPSDIFRSQTSGEELLDMHLEARVQAMIGRGLLDEVVHILRAGATSDGENDYTVGLKQAIGVKEFEAYAAHQDGASQLPCPSEQTGSRLLEEACSAYVLNTSKLARKQRRRLTALKEREEWPLHKLSATEVFRMMYQHSPGPWYEGSGAQNREDPAGLWEQAVTVAAAERVKSFLSNIGCSSNSAHSERVEQPNLWVQRTCEACGGRVLRGDYEWRSHIEGRNHKKRVAAQRKRLRQEAERSQHRC